MAETAGAGRFERVVFVGSKQLGLTVLQLLQELMPDRLVGAVTSDDAADTRSVLGEMQAWSVRNDVRLAVATSRREADELVSSLRADLCVVAGWYWLIRESMLNSVRGGWIGVHNSLLPRYRGGSPLVWQILNGDAAAGFSVFQFTFGMDEGPVWAQGSVPIEPGDQVSDVLQKLEVATIATLRRVLPGIVAGVLRPVPQDHAQASYCAQRYPEDGRIDWALSARRVHDFVRAQSAPYPGAFTTIDGRRLTVWRAIPHAAPYDGVPGRIARIEEEGIVVCCGERSAIRLLDVQCDVFRGPPAKLVRSVRQRLGT